MVWSLKVFPRDDSIHMFKKDETVVIVDPVMGDWGKLYVSYSPALSEKMKQLLPLADVITPNLTEASRLLGIPYPGNRDLTDQELEEIARALSEKGPSQVVITGISRKENVGNYVFERGRPPAYIGRRRTKRYRGRIYRHPYRMSCPR